MTSIPCWGATFSVGVDGTPPFHFQWRSNGVPVGDVIDRIFRIESLALSMDGAQFFVMVTNAFGAVTSRVATLHVVADVVPPRLLSATLLSGGRDQIMLTFSGCPLDRDSAGEVVNYTLNRGAEVLSALAYQSNVLLRTTDLQPGPDYVVTVENISDVSGNLLQPNPSQVTLAAPVFWPGYLRMDVFANRYCDPVACLPGSDPNFPDNPRERYYLAHADSRDAYPDDSHENYYARLWGYFVPYGTTNYTFYLRSDDSSQLWLSTDESPTNKVLLTEELGCCNPFSVHASAPRSLVAGQRYFLELIYREASGGDYAQVAFKHTADPADPNFLSPISGAFLASLSDPADASITITTQPADTLFSGSTGPFTLDLNNNDGGFTAETPQPYSGPWSYNATTGSWRENGQGPETSHPNTSLLNSPALVVRSAGAVVLSFDHRYSREGGNWDGCQVRISLNGAAFAVVPNTSFTQNGYNGTVLGNSSSILHGQEAFVENSPGVAAGTFITSIANLGTFAAGDVIRLQFVAASDGNTAGSTVPNWEITSMRASGLDIFLGSPAPTVTFSVAATATHSQIPNPVLTYQWFRDNGAGFILIPGANRATYSFAPAPSDSGARFRVLVSVPGATVASRDAVLTAAAIDLRRSNNIVTLSWPTGGTLQEATNLPGQWIDRSNAPNPFVVSNGSTRFFRVRFTP